MPDLETEVDASFYNLIHRLTDAPPEDETAERRRHERKPFSSVQRIAPQRGPEIPDKSEFVEVRCYNLTRAGFSFLMPSHPDFHSLVAEFSGASDTIHVAAEIVKCSDVLVDSSGQVDRIVNGFKQLGDPVAAEQTTTPMVLVGCRFTRRLHA